MTDAGQVVSSAAEVYDEFFLPALFCEWPAHLASAAALRPGLSVLDVACGTGVLAIDAARVVSPGGSVVGVDLNPGMLAVARRKSADVEWREAPAEALPFETATFDAVVSQFGLMFFQDQERALREMWRVIRPGGRLAVAVWDSLENTPGYSGVTSLLSRLFGDPIADLLRAPYSLGDTEAFGALFSASGVQGATVARVPGEAHFPSIRSWMHTDIRGWTLSDKIDDAQFEELVAEAEKELQGFLAPDGSVRFDHPALIASAQKP